MKKLFRKFEKKEKYEVNKPIEDQLKELSNKIIDRKQKIMILENNNKKPIYPKGGYIYAIQSPIKNNEKVYKIKKSKLIYIMENCVKTLTNKTFERKMKRHLNNNENFDDNEKEEIFGILAVPYDYNIDQEGGGNSQYNKIVNSFNKTKELYDSIKKMSSIVNRFAKFDKIQ